jgi:NAD(P)-dependent dehydrogenase (short-subunit alcohol dehydrogenase family)
MIAGALKGKRAIITGANQGLGNEIARQFLFAGASLMICARNNDLLRKAAEDLSASANSEQTILFQKADISQAEDVQLVVSRTINELGSCEILVNNAGIYGPKGPIEKIDWQSWVDTININLIGSVLMSKELVPHFRSLGYGKIIQISGGGATNPLPMLSAYAVSKAAIVRFAETLAEELRGTGVDVNAIAPGALNTGMLNEILEAGPEKVGQEFYDRSMRQKLSGGVPLTRGAELAVFLASSASDGITGKLISAVWDKWEDWPAHILELDQSDAYTLRRIVGKDRGIDWGDK